MKFLHHIEVSLPLVNVNSSSTSSMHRTSLDLALFNSSLLTGLSLNVETFRITAFGLYVKV